ncbi:glycosyltransferase family 4 protein [Acinetobacter baumannii]|nr:glycosyltransferase family 4 protein [Acinetobacter baumannii]ELA9137705.1 glycosyltransferase family 4 protein [Acinetobacter baumannii]ELW9271135.1 glycosyltransferase family 4 protein [Acinetobacter baumannii]HCQ9969806.1 glycosyltransferase family 4 protein [Acinetobacter baumannii]
MKKVYFLINSLSNRSGTERVACQLANIFSDNGFEIIFLNRDTAKEGVSFKLKDNIKVISFDNSLFTMAKQLRKLESSDILLIHNMGKLTCFALMLQLKCKLVSLEHGPFFAKTNLIKFLNKFFYNKLKCIVTITEKDKLNYKNLFPNMKVESIYNISPFENIGNKYNISSKRIIAVGRLAEEKNFISLVEAWSLIEHKYKDWSLNIYGDGDQYNILSNLISTYSLKRISLFPNTQDISTIYKESSFLVLSSKFEGLGMVLIEAQSFGLPTVAFDCPYGPSEIITKESGILVDNQNIEELALAIEKLINSPNIRAEMSSKALLASQRFRSSQIFLQWKEVLDTL